MANKKSGSKKSTAKKTAAKKTAPAKVETPVEETPILTKEDLENAAYDNLSEADMVPDDPSMGTQSEELNADDVAENIGQALTGAELPDGLNDDDAEPQIDAEPEVKEDVPTTPEPVAPVDYKKTAPQPDSTWKDRVLEEAKELKIKMNALRAALDGNKVPATEVDILNKQHKAMHEYYVILNTRLSR